MWINFSCFSMKNYEQTNFSLLKREIYRFFLPFNLCLLHTRHFILDLSDTWTRTSIQHQYSSSSNIACNEILKDFCEQFSSSRLSSTFATSIICEFCFICLWKCMIFERHNTFYLKKCDLYVHNHSFWNIFIPFASSH